MFPRKTLLKALPERCTLSIVVCFARPRIHIVTSKYVVLSRFDPLDDVVNLFPFSAVSAAEKSVVPDSVAALFCASHKLTGDADASSNGLVCGSVESYWTDHVTIPP